MGTTELALPKIVEVLAPKGEYETGRIKLRTEHRVVLENAKKVAAINSAEDAEQVTNFGRLLQAAVAESTAFFKTYKKQIDDIKAPILATEHEDVDPYEAEKKRLSGLSTQWNLKCQREQQEQERKNREAEEQRAREELLNRAIEAESLEGPEAAEQILSEPIIVAPSVPLSRGIEKPKGNVSTMNYSMKVLNMMQLVKAVAEGKAPAQAILVNESWLNAKARLDKEGYNVPGTELVRTPGTNFRK